MPLVPIALNKGAFANVDETELGDPSFAATQRNIVSTEAGSLRDRPGLEDFCSIGAFPVMGLTQFGSFVIAASENRRIYSITSAGVVEDITGPTELEGTARPTFATDGTYLAIAGGGSPKRWDGSGLCIDMPGSPPDCTHILSTDGYWIANLASDQEIRFAGPTSTLRETWDSSDFFSAESIPEDINALTELQGEVFAFGEDSVETFQNFGDSSVPFRRTFVLKKGTRSPYSIVQANNTHWYLNKERQFVRLEGRTPVFVSSPFDRTIQGFTTVTDCIGAHVPIDGHYFLVWTFPTEERTLVYDYKMDSWHEWSGWNGSDETRFRMSSHVYVPSWNKHIAGDYRDGTIYSLTFDAKSDGDYARRCLRRSGYIDHGTGSLKRSNLYKLHLKRGVGASSLTVAPKLLMRFKDDDKGWCDYREVDLGLTGDFEPYAEVRNTGMYRRRQIEFLMTDPAELVLTKIEEDVEVMAR